MRNINNLSTIFFSYKSLSIIFLPQKSNFRTIFNFQTSKIPSCISFLQMTNVSSSLRPCQHNRLDRCQFRITLFSVTKDFSTVSGILQILFTVVKRGTISKLNVVITLPGFLLIQYEKSSRYIKIERKIPSKNIVNPKINDVTMTSILYNTYQPLRGYQHHHIQNSRLLQSIYQTQILIIQHS